MAWPSDVESLSFSAWQNVLGFDFGFGFQQLSTDTARSY